MGDFLNHQILLLINQIDFWNNAIFDREDTLSDLK
jgi:hypothetical protein